MVYDGQNGILLLLEVDGGEIHELVSVGIVADLLSEPSEALAVRARQMETQPSAREVMVDDLARLLPILG